MHRAAKETNEKYIKVGYEDKVVFIPKEKDEKTMDVISTWKKSQGLWKDHPVFQDMTVKEVIEYLRGEDCDV